MNELIKIEDKNILTLFSNGGLNPILEAIKKEVDLFEPDLTTEKSRKEIASLSNKVAKSKTYLDGLGKELVSEWKAKSKLVDNERKSAREYLDNLKEEVRKPLTEWENEEKERVLGLQTIVDHIKSFREVNDESGSVKFSSEELKAKLKIVESMKLDSLDEYEDMAKSARFNTVEVLRNCLSEVLNAEAEKLELETLRKEKEEREKKEYEENIAKQAAEKARIEAELKAKQKEKEELEAREKIELEKKEAIRKQKEAEERARRLAIEKEQAVKKAIEDERLKTESEKIEKEIAEEKRIADKNHVEEITNKIIQDMMSVSTVSADDCYKILTAISENKISNIRITY